MGRLGLVLCVVACWACSFSGGAPIDSGTGDGDGSDASVDGTEALTFGPWPTPRRLVELEVLPGDGDASSYDDGVISDEGELFFATTADLLTEDIYVSTLVGSIFSPPQRVAELSSAGEAETTLGISPDGRTLLFGRGTGNLVDLFIARRPDTASAWQLPVPIPQVGCVDPNCVNTPGAFEGAGSLSRSGRELYFFSNRSGNFDLFRATRNGPEAAFDSVEPLTAMNTQDDELSVALSPDELLLLFSRTPSVDVLQMDLFVAKRETTSDEFGVPVRLAELNSNSLDDDFATDSMYRWAIVASRREGTAAPKLFFSDAR